MNTITITRLSDLPDNYNNYDTVRLLGIMCNEYTVIFELDNCNLIIHNCEKIAVQCNKVIDIKDCHKCVINANNIKNIYDCSNCLFKLTEKQYIKTHILNVISCKFEFYRDNKMIPTYPVYTNLANDINTKGNTITIN